MPNERTHPPRDPPPAHDDTPGATGRSTGATRHAPSEAPTHRPRPVDLAEESAAGEEDPGAGLDAPIDPATGCAQPSPTPR